MGDVTTTFTADDILAARERLIAIGKLKGQSADDVMSLNMDDLKLLIESFDDSQADPDPTTFERFVQVLNFVAQVAGPVGTIAGAFGAALGVVSAAKNL